MYEQCLSIKRETKNSTACWIRKASRAARCVSACRRVSARLPCRRRCRREPAVSDCRRRSPAAGADSCSAGWKTASWTACWRWGPPSKASPRATAGACCVPGGGADRRPAFEFARVIPAGVRRTGWIPTPTAGLARRAHSRAAEPIAVDAQRRERGRAAADSAGGAGAGLGLVPRAALASSPWRMRSRSSASAIFSLRSHCG